MKYLIDSDLVIDYLDRRRSTAQHLVDYLEQGAGISLITYGEVYEGVLHSRDFDESLKAFERFLNWVKVVPLDESTMRVFAGLRGDLRKMGMLIGDPDLIIAATAIVNDLTLLTRNTRHFNRIERLNLSQP